MVDDRRVDKVAWDLQGHSHDAPADDRPAAHAAVDGGRGHELAERRYDDRTAGFGEECDGTTLQARHDTRTVVSPPEKQQMTFMIYHILKKMRMC